MKYFYDYKSARTILFSFALVPIATFIGWKFVYRYLLRALDQKTLLVKKEVQRTSCSSIAQYISLYTAPQHDQIMFIFKFIVCSLIPSSVPLNSDFLFISIALSLALIYLFEKYKLVKICEKPLVTRIKMGQMFEYGMGFYLLTIINSSAV